MLSPTAGMEVLKTCSTCIAPMGSSPEDQSPRIKQELQIKIPLLGRSPAPILLSCSSFTFRLAFRHERIAQPLSPRPACGCQGLAATWAKPDPPLPPPALQPLHHIPTLMPTTLPLCGPGWSPWALIPRLLLGTPRVADYQLYLNTD